METEKSRKYTKTQAELAEQASSYMLELPELLRRIGLQVHQVQEDEAGS